MCCDRECVKCVNANLYHHGLDFLMWRTQLGWPTVLDTDLPMGVAAVDCKDSHS